MESEGRTEEGVAVNTRWIRAGISAASAVLLMTLACGDDEKGPAEPAPEPPAIASIDPTGGAAGTSVRIDGTRYGASQGSSLVTFAGVVAVTTLWSDTRIDATVPEGAPTGPIVVTVGGLASNGVLFTVEEPVPDLVIQRLIPSRTLIGDEVTVLGSGFEAAQGGESIEVTFAGAPSRVVAEVVAWTPTSIHVIVPDGAMDGPVQVRIGEAGSNEAGFSVAPARVSFSQDLYPLLASKGCVSCHSGTGSSGNLRLDTVANLMSGDSDHGPVVIPRESGVSILVLKLLPDPPFGDRMPLGCQQNCVGESDLLKIRDWIDQGASAE